MTNFKYVDLFSGIGGFRIALDSLGGNCVLASEIDKFAEQSYQALYGHATAGDIMEIEAKDVPDHDLLVGGFPCQAFSVAGNRKGFEDVRGTLFFEIARIAKEKQPKVLLLENVKGLVNHDKGNTLEIMIQALCEIGYTVDFQILNSKFFGVAQSRERIFIVAVRDDLVEQEDWIIEGKTIVPKGKERIQKLDGIKSFNFDYPEQSEVTIRLRDILEIDVDEKYYLSEDKTERLVAQLEHQTLPAHFPTPDDLNKTIRTGGKGSLTAKHNYDHIAEPNMVGHGIAIREATKRGYAIAEEGDAVNFQFPDSRTRRGRVGKQIANTLEASSINQGVVEAEVKSLGNVNPSGRGMNGAVYDIDAGLSPTITTNKGEGSKVSEQPKYRIRKLTPRECFRLQGFSDEAFDILRKAGLSDSQLYKQAGNAVTVNVVEAIGERLLPYLSVEDGGNIDKKKEGGRG